MFYYSDHKDKQAKYGNRQHKAMFFRISESIGMTNTFIFYLIFKRINIFFGGRSVRIPKY